MKQILFQDEPLTEKQVTNIREWIKRLRNPDEKQCKQVLYNGTGHCCLGIAERVLGKEPVFRDCNWWFGERFGLMEEDDWKAFGLRGDAGGFREPYEDLNCLVSLNDVGMPFPEIAGFIESQLKLKLEE